MAASMPPLCGSASRGGNWDRVLAIRVRRASNPSSKLAPEAEEEAPENSQGEPLTCFHPERHPQPSPASAAEAVT